MFMNLSTGHELKVYLLWFINGPLRKGLYLILNSHNAGEWLFLRNIFPGFLLEKSEKKYAPANAFSCLDPSCFARITPSKDCFA